MIGLVVLWIYLEETNKNSSQVILMEEDATFDDLHSINLRMTELLSRSTRFMDEFESLVILVNQIQSNITLIRQMLDEPIPTPL